MLFNFDGGLNSVVLYCIRRRNLEVFGLFCWCSFNWVQGGRQVSIPQYQWPH